VQAFSIRYLNTQGQLHPAADFVGDMTIVESMLAIMRGGKFIVELRKLQSIPTEGAHRRDIAVQARKMVADSLGVE